MWVEAILAKDDLDKALSDFCPLRIHLGEDGSILVSDPRSLELVPDVGLRMSVTVEVHWPVLGVQIPVSVRAAALEVKPEILKTPEGDSLTFKLRLDDIDISIFPSIIDRGVVDLVNKELEAKHVELSWNFIETLSHVFDLPAALASAAAIDLRAGWGSVRITSEALVLAISFEARVVPREVARDLAPAALSRTAPRSEAEPRPIAPKGMRGLWHKSPMSCALGIGGALLAGAGVSALVLSRRRPPTLLDSLRERF
jgi:hypothetical protein